MSKKRSAISAGEGLDVAALNRQSVDVKNRQLLQFRLMADTMQDKIKFLFTLLFILCAVQPAHADFPIWPVMSLMNIPFIATIASAGMLLVIVILLESLVLWISASLPLFESLKLSIMANLYSTFIGVCITVAYSAGLMAIVGSFIGARWFTSMFADLSENTGQFGWLAQRRNLCFILFLSGGLGVTFLGVAMMPGHGINYEHASLSIMRELEAKGVFPGTLLLLASGFLLTCISEGYVLARKMKNKDKVIKTVLLMNVVSYALLLFLSIYYFLTVKPKSHLFF